MVLSLYLWYYEYLCENPERWSRRLVNSFLRYIETSLALS